MKAISPQMPSRLRSAFTLVEMLAVMGVIALIISIAAPAVTGLAGANDVTKAVYDIAGILEQARAYAMSSNTYVYVGFHEADAGKSESGKQTEIASPNVGGRVSVAVIAAKDGTRGYDPNTLNSWDNNYATSKGNNFLTIGKVQRYNNIHMVYLDIPPDTGGMARGPYNSEGSASAVPRTYNLGSSDCQPETYFVYPLGQAKGSTSQQNNSSASYTFNKVIQYDPQGVARIKQKDQPDTIVKLIEIGLQQSHGNAATTLAKPAKTGNVAAIQIECMSGSTHVYRP